MAIPQNKKKLSADAVFLTFILTFLGPILFLRLGFSVGTLGFLGTLSVLLVSGLVAIPVASVIAEITSNLHSGGQGEYYMISRSFGLNISAPIGIALYLLQALSISFLIIAFTESFSPLFNFLASKGITFHRQYISVPCILILIRSMLKGKILFNRNILYFVAIIFIIAFFLLFLGHTEYGAENETSLFSFQSGNIKDSFFSVFSILFSAFVGITICMGLSDRLKEPDKAVSMSLTKAIMLAMIIYGFVSYKLAVSATPDDLVNNELILGNIALFGYIIIPVALAFITLPLAVSALSMAPKTLQALANDNVLPFKRLNNSMAKGKGKLNKPYNAALLTSLIVVFFVLQGELNFVARVITILMMICYGGICLISFLHHYTADPSYQPSQRSNWYVPLIGFLLSLCLIFSNKAYYAFTALALVAFVYFKAGRSNPDRKDFKSIFKSIIFQFNKSLQIYIQKKYLIKSHDLWRPSIVCLSDRPAENDKSFRLVEWISYRYGFGTYVCFIEGPLSKAAIDGAHSILNKLIKKSGKKSKVYCDTLISSSYTSCLHQLVQYPGVSRISNNMILFELDRETNIGIQKIIDNIPLLQAARLDICILAAVNKPIRYKNGINVWISDAHIEYSVLTIKLSAIIHDYPDWKNSKIIFYLLVPRRSLEESTRKIKVLLQTGKLPVTPDNIEVVALDDNSNAKEMISKKSVEAGLTIICYSTEELKQDRNILYGYEQLSDILFVNASELKENG